MTVNLTELPATCPRTGPSARRPTPEGHAPPALPPSDTFSDKPHGFWRLLTVEENPKA